jgi:pimeloyl-ACP methyl ester carboxylesterase
MAGSGPLVLLLHGFPECWWSWRHQIDSLAGAGYRVVAPDLRGYNDTEARGPYDLETLRDDLVALLDHLAAPSAYVVGHDWGAVVAWHLAATRGRCAALAVINGPHPAVFGRALVRRPRQWLRSAYIVFFQLPWLPEMLLTRQGGRAVVKIIRGLAVDKRHFSDEELRPFAEAVCKPGRASAMIGWYRHLPARLVRSRVDAPGPVSCPVLVVWGLRDRALGFGDLVPGMREFAPSLEVCPIAGAGHFVHEEQPEAVNRKLLSFLAALRAG